MQSIRAHVDTADDLRAGEKRLLKEERKSPVEHGQIRIGAPQREMSVNMVPAMALNNETSGQTDPAHGHFFDALQAYLTAYLYDRKELKRGEKYCLWPDDMVQWLFESMSFDHADLLIAH